MAPRSNKASNQAVASSLDHGDKENKKPGAVRMRSLSRDTEV